MSIQFSEGTASPQLKEASIVETESAYESTFSILDPGTRYSLLPLEEKTQLRLLQLLPGAADEPIVCKLYVVDRGDNPRYSALSYTWGDVTQVMSIEVNGLEWFVTENLYFALLHLRQEDDPLTLWVDALCIDQKNDEEKSWHVQQMRQTFGEAERALVWLGTGSDDAQAAMSMLQRIGSVGSALGKEETIWGDDVMTEVVERFHRVKETENGRRGSGSTTNLQDSNSLDDLFRDIVTKNEKGLYFPEPGTFELFSLSWWQRTWVLQELAVSNDIHMVCGNAMMSESDMVVAAQLYYQYQTSVWAKDERKRIASVTPESAIDHLTSPISKIEQAVYAQFTSRWAHLNRSSNVGLPLAFLLSSTYTYGATRVLKASDARDYVFALLGLATDSHSLGLVADYTRSKAAVYIEVARALVTHGYYIALSWCRSKETRLISHLPSWVPDLAHRIHRPFQWVVLSKTKDKYILEPKYSASRGLQGGRNTLLVPDANRFLHLQGVVVDTIHSCGTSLEELYRRTSLAADSMARVCVRWLKELKMTIEDSPSAQNGWSAAARVEALWRSSVADAAMSPSWEKKRWTAPIPDFFIRMYHLNFPFDQMIENEAMRSHFTMMDVVNIARRPFTSEKGYVGLGPDDIVPGDKIVVFCGAEMPHVLRTGADGVTTLIGDVYVHGIMDGLEGPHAIQTFELH